MNTKLIIDGIVAIVVGLLHIVAPQRFYRQRRTLWRRQTIQPGPLSPRSYMWQRIFGVILVIVGVGILVYHITQ